MESHKSAEPLPVQDIARRIANAATSETWRSGERIAQRDDSLRATVTERTIGIQRALERAHRKAFVPAIKPLRRLLRNQGAVNDSVIEALYHLAAEIERLADEERKLRERVVVLEAELREHRLARSQQP